MFWDMNGFLFKGEGGGGQNIMELRRLNYKDNVDNRMQLEIGTPG